MEHMAELLHLDELAHAMEDAASKAAHAAQDAAQKAADGASTLLLIVKMKEVV
jgi:hypothetical protein